MPTRRHVGEHSLPDWSAGAMRRSVVYQPFGALLTIPLAPAFPWKDAGGSYPSARPFQAHAQGSTCRFTTDSISKPKPIWLPISP
jgi:hypothetical protein